jgi:penicillin amidase
LAGLAFLGALQASAADTEKMTLPGLAAPAQILVDPWGVPHLYAASADDLFFVQGFNAARDRLFQIDLWRRRGLGRLASVFGPDFVEQDRAARLFLYRGDMAREWRSYGADAQRVATRFVAASMPYIDLVARDPRKASVEFHHFGYAPEKVAAEDVVRIRSHGLVRNLVSEISRAIVTCHSDLKSDTVRIACRRAGRRRSPRASTLRSTEAMRAYTLATQSVLMPSARGSPQRAPGEANFAVGEPAATPEGSNAWVVAPGKSATAGPSSPAIRTAATRRLRCATSCT